MSSTITVDQEGLERLLLGALRHFDAGGRVAYYDIAPSAVSNMAAHMIAGANPREADPAANPVDQDEADRNREAEVAEAEGGS